jgi:hypothetical protein
MAAAVPFAMQGGAALYSYFKNKKTAAAQNTAMQATQQSGQQLAGAAPPLLAQGQQLAQQGSGYLQQGAQQLRGAGNYYGDILSNRRSARESLAPETATALEYYRGAGNKVQRTMTGGSRDYAQAELDRQKTGQIAGFLPAARANAAQGMERVGSATGNLGGSVLNAGSAATGAGVNAAMGGGYLNNMAFGQGQQQRQNSADSGNAWGKLFSSALSAYLNRGKGSGGGGGGASAGWMSNSNNFGGG